LEHDLSPVQTFRGDIDVPNARLGARRALEAAMRAYPNSHWRSVVIVLERLEPVADTSARPAMADTAIVAADLPGEHVAGRGADRPGDAPLVPSTRPDGAV
jgi:hypothetical protein